MIKGFPYTPRKNQDVLIELVMNTLDDGAHLVVESGTGTGKTVCVLTPAVDAALKAGKKVLYLTHTNSQQHQVILELRKIKGKEGRRVVSIDYELCKDCRICVDRFGCPAMFIEDERVAIDSTLCNGCGVCLQKEVCAKGAIGFGGE